MIDYNTQNPAEYEWIRTKESLITEWDIHNLAYSLFIKRSRTADCDFDENDEGKGLIDFAWDQIEGRYAS